MKRIHYQATGLLLLALMQFSCTGISKENQTQGWNISPDGSYSLFYGELSIQNIFPAINDAQIHPVKTSVKRNKQGGVITYQLQSGKVILVLGKDESGYTVQTKLLDFQKAPDWILPLASGRVGGADRFYKQGFGFGGASGVYPIPVPQSRIESARLKENTWSYDSYLFTALISSANQTLVFSAYQHKDYQHRSTLYNRQHRIGLIDRHMDTDVIYFESSISERSL